MNGKFNEWVNTDRQIILILKINYFINLYHPYIRTPVRVNSDPKLNATYMKYHMTIMGKSYDQYQESIIKKNLSFFKIMDSCQY